MFSADDRAAARTKLAKQAREVEDLARDRARRVRDKDAATQERVMAIRSELPEDVMQLRTLRLGGHRRRGGHRDQQIKFLTRFPLTRSP